MKGNRFLFVGFFMLMGFIFYACSPLYYEESPSGSSSNSYKEDASYYVNKCCKYDKQRQYKLAFKACTKAIELDPKFALAYLGRGWALYNLGLYQEAIEDFNKAIKLNHKLAAAYNDRGMALTKLGHYKEAIENYNKAIKLASERYSLATAYNNRGWALAELGCYKKAIEDLNKAIELDPKYMAAYAYNNRGYALSRLNRFKEAIRDFNKAIELDPKNALAYSNKAWALTELGHYEEAIRNCNQAIRLDPMFALAYQNRACALARLNRYEEAIKDFNKAIELHPKRSEILTASYSGKGLIYALDGKWEMALRDLNKVIELDTKDAGTYYDMAYVLYKLGFLDKAKQKLSKAVELDPRILEKQGKSLFKPCAKEVLRLYAKEYLFASNYINVPKKYLARAKAILNIKEKSTALASLDFQTPSKGCVPTYPNRYLLAVLVSSYDELPNLGFVKNDKKLILNLAICFLGVPKNHILVLQDPTLGEFRSESRRFLSSILKRDALVFFYYSGHGTTDQKGQFYFLPKDASIDTPTDLADTALSLTEVEEKLFLAKGMKLAMIDACRVQVPWKPAVLIKKPVTQKNLALIFATGKGQISVADRNGKTSVFLDALYHIANNGADNLDFDNSGYVELSELTKALKAQVEKASGGLQRPVVTGTMSIPIFPVR